MDKLEEVSRVLPHSIRKLMKGMQLDLRSLQEIRLRVLRPFIIVYESVEYYVSADGQLSHDVEFSHIVTQSEIKESFELLSEFSTYAYEEEMRLGYITIQGGHRVGIAGKAVIECGKIKNLKNISFINIRVANERPGCADRIVPMLYEEDRILHTLIISPPRGGKTTLLRDIIRQLSDGSDVMRGRNVGVVDERSEICACYRGIPQNDVGVRTDVLDACPKVEGMMRLVRSMSPEVVAVDEIGTEEDFDAVGYVLTCGCSVIATAHGHDYDDIKSHPILSRAITRGYFQRYVVLAGGSMTGQLVYVLDENGRMVTNGD